MEIAYLNTIDDFTRLPFRSRWQQFVREIIEMSIWLCWLFLPGSLLCATQGLWTLLAVCWATIVILAAVVWFRFWRKALQRFKAGVWSQTTMRLGEYFYQLETNVGRHRFDWSTIQRVIETPERLFLFTEPGGWRFHVIPKSAFSSREQQSQFMDFVSHRIAATVSLEQDFVAAQPRWPISEPTLLAEADVLCCQPTAEQYAQAQHDDFREKPFGPRFTTWILPLGLLTACVLLPNSQESGGAGRYIIAIGGGALLTCFSYLWWEAWDRWRFKRRLDARSLAPVTIAVTPQGIAYMTCLSEGFERWDAFSEAWRNDEIIGIYRRNDGCAYVIPEQSLDDEEAVENWFARIDEFIKKNKSIDPPHADTTAI